MNAGARPGWLAGLTAFASLLSACLLVWLLSDLRWLDLLSQGPRTYYHAPLGLALLSLLQSALGSWLARRARGWSPGNSGKLRLHWLGSMTALSGLANTALLTAIYTGSDSIGPAPLFREATMGERMSGISGEVSTYTSWLALPLSILAVLAAGSCWRLAARPLRNWVWRAVDTGALVGLIFTSLQFGLTPANDSTAAVFGSATRLGLTAFLCLRLAARLLPFVLDLLERTDLRSLVAARHLRARKSGFLAAISGLSILAVGVSSCAMSTTLSVMGGFRDDLERKILGANAHVLVVSPEGRFRISPKQMSRLREVAGVAGVSSFLGGEVMVSSASNIAGALLHGIDTAHIGEVSDLARSLKGPKGRGSIDLLANPDKLSEEIASRSALSPIRGWTDFGADLDDVGTLAPKLDSHMGPDLAPKPGHPGTNALPHVGAGHQPLDRVPPDNVEGPPVGSRRALTPGLLVGHELARSLRLYLGDEVNVVSPLGSLGPSGPMPRSRAFRIAGIFYTGMYEYDMKRVYTTLPIAQTFLSAKGRVSGVEIKVTNPSDAPSISHAVESLLKGAGLGASPWQERNSNLFGALALEKIAMFVTLGIAVLVASFCIASTLTLMVKEKGREVAVLKAMGTPDHAVVTIFVMEGGLIGVLGAGLGLATGYLVCFAAEHLGIPINEQVFYIDRLPVHTNPLEFAMVGLAAVAVCLVVTIYPAWMASRLHPVEALRHE